MLMKIKLIAYEIYLELDEDYTEKKYNGKRPDLLVTEY